MHILRGIRIMMVRLITRATRHYELRATCFPRGGVPTGTSLLFSMDFVHIMLDCQNIQSDILAKGKSRPIIVVTQTWFQFPGRLFSCFSQNFGEMVESQKWLICWMTKFKMKIWFDIIMLNASTFFFSSERDDINYHLQERDRFWLLYLFIFFYFFFSRSLNGINQLIWCVLRN